MAKKPKRSTVEKKLDTKAREVLKEVYPSYCVTCNKSYEWFHPINNPYGLQVSHYIKREVKQLRWDSRNIHPMCSSCNINHNSNPAPYSMYLIDVYGENILNELNEVRRQSRAMVKPIPIDKLEDWYNKGMKPLLNGSLKI